MDVFTYLIIVLLVFFGTLAGFFLSRMTREELRYIDRYAEHGAILMFAVMISVVIYNYSIIFGIIAGIAALALGLLLRKKDYLPFAFALLGIMLFVASLQESFFLIALLACVYTIFMTTHLLYRTRLRWGDYFVVIGKSFYFLITAVLLFVVYGFV